MNASDSIFSKSNQSQLFEHYKEALVDIWGKDTRMIDYCMKRAQIIISVSDNCIIPIDKERIETEFWFGYSDIGQGRSQAENNELVERTHDTLVEYFMDRNLEGVNKIIEDLENISNDSHRTIKKVTITRGTHNSKYTICGLRINDPWRNTYEGTDLTTEEINTAIEGYKIYKEKLIKRLETYLKKYDTSKLSIQTYWMDR